MSKSSMQATGFDQLPDDPQRITVGPNFVVNGGSQDTHEMLHETVVKVNESLAKRGKTLDTAQPQEIIDAVFKFIPE